MAEHGNPSSLNPAQRRNAWFLVVGQTASKLGDVTCSAKTVLTWLMGMIGAPPAMTALLVPIRESGSMLPQAFLSGLVKRVQRRKWVYATGAIGQTLCLAGMALAALSLRGTAAGFAVVVCLALSSLARCLCSIASKDVLGKTLPKGSRGRINGTSASISGLLGLGVALAIMLLVNQATSQNTYAWLILAGSLLYLVASVAMLSVKEDKSEEQTEGLLKDFMSRVRLVWEDPKLRRFIITRTLLLGSALASPYLVILSQQHGFELRSLAAFVFAGGLASASSSLMWGKLSDLSSRSAMAAGGGIAAVIGLIAAAINTWIPQLAANVWTWPSLFFLLNLGYAGVRIGRKTYVVDSTEGSKRTDYVSASNTLIAIMILILGAAGSGLQSLHDHAALIFFSVLCLTGCVTALKLKT